MAVKLYIDRLSQPSRAILIFCKVNGIDYEEVKINLSKGQQRTPEFKEINPMRRVPTIVDGELKLFESHAIMCYLATAKPGVPDHWYPTNLISRAKVQSILDWHHSNLRFGAGGYVYHSMLAPALGFPLDTQAAKDEKEVLMLALSIIETLWLTDDAKFLLGNSEPSIPDLSLVCEIMQLEFLEEADRETILQPHSKILQWIDDVKSATSPHFEEVHEAIYQVRPLVHSMLASVKNSSNEGES